MDPYQSQQPDEGYSEDPLNGSGYLTSFDKTDASATIALLRSRIGSELTPQLARHIASLSLASQIQLAESLLEGLPTSAVADIVEKLYPRLYIDFIRCLPTEICLKILGYLDPLSLMKAAKACRSWYFLAIDRQLWERHYFLDGFKIITAELKAAEQSVNRERPVPSAGGHALKRRAISALRRTADNDVDHTMMDDDRRLPSPIPSPIGDGQTTLTPLAAATSLFGSGTPLQATRDAKGKGKERVSSSIRSPSIDPSDVAAPLAMASNGIDRLPKTKLWLWEEALGRYRVNWKYLYSMRRRLEINWDEGRYTTFQFPHPNHPEEAHSDGVYIIQYTPEYLVSGSRDCTIRIWDMRRQRLVRPPLTGHTRSVLCLQFDASPEEDLIISGSSDTNVILWQFSTGKMLQRLASAHYEPVLNVKFDKRILVTCSKDRMIKIFNRRELRPGDLGYDSSKVPLVNETPVHQIKDYANNALDDIQIIPPYTEIGILEGHSAAVNAVQIHGDEVVSASGDRNVKIWDWPTQTCTRTFLGHSKGIACVQYDGRRIISGSSDHMIKVFDRQSGVEVATLKAHEHLVRTVQAGFGDTVDSIVDDEREARLVDKRYLKAVREGTFSASLVSSRRRNERNASGSAGEKSSDILFTGSKLPPGGGGGKYGRIVSGSYDMTVIIWRRNKDGSWKAHHHLKQEVAAAAASASASANRQRARRMNATHAPALVTPAAPAAPATTTTPTAAAQTAPAPTPAASIAQLSTPISALIDPSAQAEGSSSVPADPSLPVPPLPLSTLIETLVLHGASSLQHALLTNPLLLSYTSYIHSAIDRQPSSFLRSQLRQTINTALVRVQYDQRSRATAAAAAAAAAAARSGGQGSSSNAGVAATSSTTVPAMFRDAQGTAPTSIVPGLLAQSTPSAPALAPITAAATAVSASIAAAATAATASAASAAAPDSAATMATVAAEIATATAPTLAVAQMNRTLQRTHHPLIPQADALNPQRVYKLQFDASRIICCSQSSLIVGWDFANGDPEILEAVKFFEKIS